MSFSSAESKPTTAEEDEQQQLREVEKKAEQEEREEQQKEEEKEKEKERVARVQTDEEYVQFLSKVMSNFVNFLGKFQEFMKSHTPEQVTAQPRPLIEYLGWLNEFYGQMGKFKMTEKQLAGYRAKAGATLAEFQQLIDDLARCAVYLYRKYKDSGFASNEDDVNGEHERVYARMILGNFHNFTDCSLEFCVSFAKADFFFSELICDGLTAWFDRHTAEDQKVARAIINTMLGMTYNMFFKNNSHIYDSLSRLGVVEAVKPYLRSSNVKIQVHSLILIAFAMDESQADLYLGAKEVVEYLVEQLASSLDRPDRRSNGYHTIELSVCVNRLALNDVNKQLLMGTKLLPALLRMLRGRREDEVAAALDILFTLSFLAQNRQRIMDEFGDPLRALMTDAQPRQEPGKGLWRECRSLQGLDFNLNEQLSSPLTVGAQTGKAGGAVSGDGSGIGARPQSARQLRRRATTADPESVPACVLQGEHVMISYQHESKETVCRIKDELVRAGIKVWIDFEHMAGGSTLSSMADAVESSYAFLMCMSRKYKDSNNCRVEAEYAWRLGKRVVPLLLELKYKPTGWLGIMLGVNLFYDFSGKYAFGAKIQELLRVVGEARHAARGVSEPGGGGEPLIERAEAARPLGGSRPGSAASTISGAGAGTAAAAAGREHNFPSAYSTLPPIGAASTGPRTSGLRGWNAEDTRRWVESRGVPLTAGSTAGASAVASLTGEELHFLVACKRSAPEAFHRVVEKYLAFDCLRELAAFVNALDEL